MVAWQCSGGWMVVVRRSVVALKSITMSNHNIPGAGKTVRAE